MPPTRRSMLATSGAFVAAVFTGCSADDTWRSDDGTAVSTTTGQAGPETVRATGASITVREDLALDSRNGVADYDLEAGTVELVEDRSDGEVVQTQTIDIEAYAYRRVGHAVAANAACERLLEREDIERTGVVSTPQCWLGTADRPIVNVDFVPEDHAVSVETVTEGLPRTVGVTLDSAAGEYTAEYPVFVVLREPFVQE